MKYSVLLFGTTPAWRSSFNNIIYTRCALRRYTYSRRTGCIGSVPALCLFYYYSLESLIIFRIIISHYHNGHKYLTLQPPQSTHRIIRHSVFFCVHAVRGRTDRIGGLLGTTGTQSPSIRLVIRHGIVHNIYCTLLQQGGPLDITGSYYTIVLYTTIYTSIFNL